MLAMYFVLYNIHVLTVFRASARIRFHSLYKQTLKDKAASELYV